MRIAAALALALLAACGAPQVGDPASTGALVTPGLGPTLQPTGQPAGTSTGSISVGTSSPVPIGMVSNLAVTPPPDAQADDFAVAFLDTIQARSFAERREFCGYFVLDAAGLGVRTATAPGSPRSTGWWRRPREMMTRRAWRWSSVP